MPIVFSFFAEVLSREKRGEHLSWLCMFWMIGEIYASAMAWAIIPHYGESGKTHIGTPRLDECLLFPCVDCIRFEQPWRKHSVGDCKRSARPRCGRRRCFACHGDQLLNRREWLLAGRARG